MREEGAVGLRRKHPRWSPRVKALQPHQRKTIFRFEAAALAFGCSSLRQEGCLGLTA